VCGEPGHIARKCHQRKGKKGSQMTANVVVRKARGSGYEPEILLACQSTNWWLDTGANIHVCSDLNLISTYQVANGCSVLMGNGSRAAVQGVRRVDLKLTSGNTLSLKNVHHSRLCHINFDRIIRLSKLNLIPEIPIVRRSKCHACVQAKKPHKPFKSVEEKSLAPLELIHSDLCEMNGILTKGGKDISYLLLMKLLDGVNSILLRQKMRL
jgi:hypothetical protein